MFSVKQLSNENMLEYNVITKQHALHDVKHKLATVRVNIMNNRVRFRAINFTCISV